MHLLVAEVGGRAHAHPILLEGVPHQRRGQVRVPGPGSPAGGNAQVRGIPDADQREPAPRPVCWADCSAGPFGDSGEVSDLTRQQVELALTAAARKDDAFGQTVTELIARLLEAEQAACGQVTAGPGSTVFTGNVEAKAEGGVSRSARWPGRCTSARGRRALPSRAGQPLTVPGILPGTESAARPEWPGSSAAGADGIPQGLAAGQGRDGAIWIGSARHVTVFQGISSAVARSAYLEQVRRIAPPDPPGLLDRDAELAELARFCLDPDGASYTWWRAGPWAGKSALLSTFVLRPPPEVAERLRIVSFFITARLAAQDTRDAFTGVLLEQSAALLGLPAARREACLLDLLSQAAVARQEAGRRLVLVVDGLDGRILRHRNQHPLCPCPGRDRALGRLPHSIDIFLTCR